MRERPGAVDVADDRRPGGGPGRAGTREPANRTETPSAPGPSRPAPLRVPPDRSLLRRIYGEAHPYRLRIAGLLLLSLLGTPLALAGPVPLKVAVDNVVGREPLSGALAAVAPGWLEASFDNLLVLAVVLQVLVVVLIQLQSAAVSVMATSTVERLSVTFRARLLQHAQRLSFAYHDRTGTSDSIYRIQYDAPAISNLAVTTLIPLLSAALTVVAMMYVMVVIDWQLAAVALAISPILYLLGRSYRRRMRPRYREAKRLESSALGVVQEVLTSFRVVKSFGTEERENLRYRSTSSESADAQIHLARAEGVFGVLVSATTAFGTAGVLYVGVKNVEAGLLSLGEMLLVLSYVAQLYSPLKTVSRKVASIQSQLAGAARAFELIDELPDVKERTGAKGLRRADGNIQFVEATFGYVPGVPVLDHLSFEVEPGTRLGIAGPTGAGKTTLIGLLTRFYDVQAGSIHLDGLDVRDYRLTDLRAQFAVMPQEPLLFSTSIAENIAYARPDATWDEVREAARAAGADSFVSDLPNGYDTLVGERGMLLSGGERQRISLARAFLKNAPILILDEPTSSIDAETERAILDALLELMSGRTTLLISHRSSSLAMCDLVLRLDPPGGGCRPGEDDGY